MKKRCGLIRPSNLAGSSKTRPSCELKRLNENRSVAFIRSRSGSYNTDEEENANTVQSRVNTTFPLDEIVHQSEVE